MPAVMARAAGASGGRQMLSMGGRPGPGLGAGAGVGMDAPPTLRASALSRRVEAKARTKRPISILEGVDAADTMQEPRHCDPGDADALSHRWLQPAAPGRARPEPGAA